MRPALVALLALLLLSACGEPPPPEASGAEIYAELCAGCHGANLEGGMGPPLGPGSEAAEAPHEALVTTIVRGQGSRMPAFGRVLTEEQVLRLVDFLREQQEAA